MTYADAFLARYYHYNYCAYKIKVYSISREKKLKYCHFLLSFGCKFHFSFGEICDLQSQVFTISGKEA